MQYWLYRQGALLLVCAVLYGGSQGQSSDTGGCRLSPCRHGGTCVTIQGAQAYRCKCPADYGGQHCEFRLEDCGHPAGLADGSITDSQLSASSALDRNDPKVGAGRLHGQVPWRPSADDSAPWIQVDLNVTSIVVGVVTEGIKQFGTQYYVTSFKVSSSLDGVKWSRYKDPSSFSDVQFSVNNIRPATTRFDSAITARYFRLYPTNSTVQGDIRLKMEVLTCKDDCSHLRAPCLHGGSCSNDQGVHNFNCACQDGFYGDRCGQIDQYRTCAVPLGLENSEISDSQLSASSQKSNYVSPQKARLNSRKGGWRPDPTDYQPWLQVDLLRPTLVTGVVTQGRTGIWVETYKIGYSDDKDDGSFVIYKNPDGSDKVFEANLNDGDSMRNDVSPPIRARYIRVLPHTWSPLGIKLRLELLTCGDTYCSTAMGLQSGAVADDQMTASSFMSGYQPWTARLNNTRAWQMDKEDRTQWLQIDLLREVLVTGVQTQGLKGGRVESYRLMYSDDGKTFVIYQNSIGQDKVFDGNTDGDTVVTHDLQRPVVARYLRFNPETWRPHYPRIRVEVLGCNDIPVIPPSASTIMPVTSATTSEVPPTREPVPSTSRAEACNQPLGMMSGAIDDSQLAASSAVPGYEASKARLNGTRSWHMALLDTQQWLQVDLGQRKIVTGIQTQGRWGGHVKSYRLFFHGQEGKGNWAMFEQPGVGKAFDGNSDGDSIVQHDLHVPMVTRYLRVNPVSWPGKLPRLRMELLGCDIYPDCYHPLGMEDGGISDSQVTASSWVSGYEPWRGRLHGPRAWQPKAGDEKQWLQIDLQQATVVTGLETQPLWEGPTKALPLTSYSVIKLLYSDDGFQWTLYNSSSGTVYNANHGREYVIRHTLVTPLVTRYVRFKPQFRPGNPPRIRLEVLGCTGGWKPTLSPPVTEESHVTLSVTGSSQSSTSARSIITSSQSSTSTRSVTTSNQSSLSTFEPIQPTENPMAEQSAATTLQQTTSRFSSPVNYITGKMSTKQWNSDETTEVTFTEGRITGKPSNITEHIKTGDLRGKQRGNAVIIYIIVGVIAAIVGIAGIIVLIACYRRRSKRADGTMLMEEFNLDSSALYYTGEYVNAADNPTNESVTDDTKGLLENGHLSNGDGMACQT